MVTARIRRFAWLLILVLVTGLAAPMLASATPCDPSPAVSAHPHVDGTMHSHAVRAGHEGVGKTADRTSGGSSHCPRCLTDAACAVSCLGLAILPVTADLTSLGSAAAWSPEVDHVLAGVSPLGDIDPPRPVLS